MAKVLILGCGYVGTALGLSLAEQGDDVFGARRQPENLPAPIKPMVLDLAALSPQALPEVDYVVYLPSAGAYTEAAYQRTYHQGMAQVAKAFADKNQYPTRLIYVSSTTVYAQHQGEWVDESSPTDTSHFAAKHLLAGEQVALDLPCESIVLRFSGIYGPGRLRLLEHFLSGKASLSPTPTWTNHIHLADCVGMLQHLLKVSHPAPRYLGTDNEPTSKNDIYRWFAEQTNQPLPPQVAESSDAPQRHASHKRCSNRLIRESGYSLAFPTFREGFSYKVISP